ncbi:nucleoside 2-deoxyribosyltransferase [Staphylococcus phage VB-SauS-SA2]|nr:nucleoside 2-deoxyribosyltransferase [Staphylococcus phage VB-SauS-SA2]
MNYIKDKVIYMGGHILNDAMVDYRDKQHKQVEGIIGATPYSPHKDKSINDKANAEQTQLAERILNNDFKAMQESDIFVFDILNEGLGTIAELGILLGMKHQAQKVINELKEIENKNLYLTEEEYDLRDTQQKILDKPVLIYCSDIRQGHGKGYSDPDRAEFSTNQFVYGMVLSLTNGEGFISWEEVLKRLENI